MLQKLIIHNYAIIDHLEVDFGAGLTILTGETGAGKSIVVGALGLLLGERVLSGILRKGEKSGYVEGYFKIDKKNVVLRREMTASGGSKYLIDGQVKKIQEARGIFEELIDLHGQHQHQSLLQTENYYAILDRFSGLENLSYQISNSYRELSRLISLKNNLKQKMDEIDRMRDFLEFQLKEIEGVSPQVGEVEILEQEAKVLKNSETIEANARECYKLLYDNADSAAVQMGKSQRLLAELKEFIPDYDALSEDMASALVSVEEVAAIIQKYTRKVEIDPDRLEAINERLSSLKQLQRKYKCDVDGLIKKGEEIKNDLSRSENFDFEKKNLEKDIEKVKADYKKRAVELSKKRKKSAELLQKNIADRLKVLGMEKSLFEVVVDQNESEFSEQNGVDVEVDGKQYTGNQHGIDTIDFIIATGKAESFLPISQIASGGEMSRIMLSIKSVLLEADKVPVLVFDEIDTGISGRIASAVGRELRLLAKYHQVLCITHLPQIAGMADTHFSVEKVERNGRVVTNLVALDEKGKEFEIAKLLAGDKVSAIHLENAKELIKSAAEI